jgi:ferredoxin
VKVEGDLVTCQRYGHCVFEAPAVFALDDEGELHYDAEPADEELAGVQEAARACPVSAITVAVPSADGTDGRRG